VKAGLNIGFILKLYLGEEKVVTLWERFIEKMVDVVTSLICGYEFFKVLGAKGEVFEKMRNFWKIFKVGVEVMGVDENIIWQGAKFEVTHRLGAFDSLILASFLEKGCSIVCTTDAKWK